MSHALGRFHVAEPPHHLAFLHRHQGEPLREVMHDVPLAVLEQENFAAQGIDTSALVPGAPKVDALGNCVYNTGTAAVSTLGLPAYEKYLNVLGLWNMDGTQGEAFADAKLGEEAAIVAYHKGTDLTGDTSTEWPPTDCGSSGVYLAQFLQSLGVISGQKIAHGAQDLVSLLQTGVVAQGSPWFNSWFEPDANGFVDGNGTSSDLEAAIRSGVAGGHETLQRGIEKLTLTATDQVDPSGTIIRVRNSWGESFGDHGDYLIHLSTLVALGQYCDFRQFVA